VVSQSVDYCNIITGIAICCKKLT